MQAPKVIKQYGRPTKAYDVDGREIFREDKIYLETHRQWYPTPDFDNHFLFKSRRIGSSVLCTCGSAAITVGYHMYRKYFSKNVGEMLFCMNYLNYGNHADGSH